MVIVSLVNQAVYATCKLAGISVGLFCDINLGTHGAFAQIGIVQNGAQVNDRCIHTCVEQTVLTVYAARYGTGLTCQFKTGFNVIITVVKVDLECAVTQQRAFGGYCKTKSGQLAFKPLRQFGLE